MDMDTAYTHRVTFTRFNDQEETFHFDSREPSATPNQAWSELLEHLDINIRVTHITPDASNTTFSVMFNAYGAHSFRIFNGKPFKTRQQAEARLIKDIVNIDLKIVTVQTSKTFQLVAA